MESGIHESQESLDIEAKLSVVVDIDNKSEANDLVSALIQPIVGPMSREVTLETNLTKNGRTAMSGFLRVRCSEDTTAEQDAENIVSRIIGVLALDKRITSPVGGFNYGKVELVVDKKFGYEQRK